MSRDSRIALATIGIAAVSALLQLTGTAAALRYDRADLAGGEVWRAISGHFVHLGPTHLALNVAGLALVALLVGRHLSLPAWGTALAVAVLSTSAGLWWFSPGVGWYVGLSGVLHGLLVAGAGRAAWRGPEHGFNALLLAAVAAKLAWEQWFGPLPGTAALAGGTVIVDAHLYGAAGGLLVATAAALRRR